MAEDSLTAHDGVNLIELFEKSYYHELDRRDRIVNSLAISVAALTFFVGVAGYLFSNYDFTNAMNHLSAFHLWFVISDIGVFISCMVGSIFLFMSATGQKYSYIPSALDTRAYLAGLESYYAKLKVRDVGGKLRRDLDSYLLDRYTVCSAKNFDSNNVKSKHRFWCNIFLSASIFFTISATIPYVIVYTTYPPSQRIEIINFEADHGHRHIPAAEPAAVAAKAK